MPEAGGVDVDGRATEADVAALAAALPALAPTALTLLTARRPGPVITYLRLLTDAGALQLDAPEAEAFQRCFNGYYGVRRNSAWRAQYYALFEAAKTSTVTSAELFDDTLARIAAATARVEASFASKLVATLRPGAPVIDSLIRMWLAAQIAAPPFGGGTVEAGAYFRWLEDLMVRLAATAQAQAWARQFDIAFRDLEGAAAIHPVKKLDFLIWAGGRA